MLIYNRMVVDDRVMNEDDVDRIFRALCDRTRRDILHRAMTGSLSVSGLARRYPMTTTAVQKHVRVLEDAGLVERHRRGREQIVQTRIDAIERARRLLGVYEQLWRARVAWIDKLLADDSSRLDRTVTWKDDTCAN